MKIKLIIVVFMSCLWSGCSKEEEEAKPEPETTVPITKLKYFENKNEEWFYEVDVYGPPTEYESMRRYTYKVARDTSISTVFGTRNATILTEDYHSFYKRDTINKFMRHRELILFFYPPDKTLYYFDVYYNKEISRINFNLIDTAPCDIRLRDSVLFDRKYTLRYVNEYNQEFFQGISLGLYQCLIYPPDDTIPVDHHVTKMHYRSDQFAYYWEL